MAKHVDQCLLQAGLYMGFEAVLQPLPAVDAVRLASGGALHSTPLHSTAALTKVAQKEWSKPNQQRLKYLSIYICIKL